MNQNLEEEKISHWLDVLEGIEKRAQELKTNSKVVVK